MTPEQLTASVSKEALTLEKAKMLARQAHLEARQSEDLIKDLRTKLLPSSGPVEAGQSIYYYEKALSKVKSGQWKAGRVMSIQSPSMVTVSVGGNIFVTNKSKLRRNPDDYHDVIIPGIEVTEQPKQQSEQQPAAGAAPPTPINPPDPRSADDPFVEADSNCCARFNFYCEEHYEWFPSADYFVWHHSSPQHTVYICLLYTSPSPRDRQKSRMPSSA